MADRADVLVVANRTAGSPELLAGKRLLITGVTNRQSIAFAVAS